MIQHETIDPFALHNLLPFRTLPCNEGNGDACGRQNPSVDLFIGATALEHGYSIATVNLRHFRLIPGLNVLQL
jgi:hypothetical protein